MYDRLEIIEGAIGLKFQHYEKKIVEKATKVFEKRIRKGNENLSFDELMETPVSNEKNDEYDIPSQEEMLEFYIEEIIYDDIIEAEIRHIDDNSLLGILDQKGYGCLFVWKHEISKKYVEKVLNEIKDANN